MTKFEYLTKCDFNNLPLRSKIEKIIEMLDGGYQTLPDVSDQENTFKCDENGNPCEDGKYYKANGRLSASNSELRKMFPSLDNIMISLRNHKYDVEKTYSDILQKDRDIKLNDLGI